MGTRIFVGNISFESSEQDLQDLFSAEGRKVERVSIVSDRQTGRPRGFAFVDMATEDDTKAAIAALDGKNLHGRDLRVSPAHDKPVRDAGRSSRRF